MSELMRFRIARAPQKKVPDPLSVLRLDISIKPVHTISTDKQELTNLNAIQNIIFEDLSTLDPNLRNALQSKTSIISYLDLSSPFFADIAALDNFLTQYQPPNADAPTIDDLTTFLNNNNLSNLLTDWQSFIITLENVFCLALLLPAPPNTMQIITRYLLLAGLVDIMNNNPAQVASSDDIVKLLRWRTIIIPEKIDKILQNNVNQKRLGENWQKLSAPGGIFTARPGFADLYVTTQKWYNYEPAEIAYIENVLPGEFKERKHFELDQTSRTNTVDTSKTTTQENSKQTTDTSQLSTQSSSDVNLSLSINGQVSTSGQYGPTKVDTSLGGSLDYSTSQANSTATTQSKETVDRAVTTVTTTVRQIQTTQTLTKIKDLEDHQIDNKGQVNAVVGIFRWVDEVSTVTLTKYPNRFLMEFVVPEPGAWLRWLNSNPSALTMLPPLPEPLTVDITFNGTTSEVDLDPTLINDSNYLQVGARYATQGLIPPPAETQIITTAILKDPGSTTTYFLGNNTNTDLIVPDGYIANCYSLTAITWWDSWIYYGDGGDAQQYMPDEGVIYIAVGSNINGPIKITINSSQDRNHRDGGKVIQNSLLDLPISQGMPVPISIQTARIAGYSINVEVTCNRTTEAYTAWQIQTFESISSAYYSLKQDYDEALAKSQVNSDGQALNFGDNNNPETNIAIVSDELKRQVIEFFLGSPFLGREGLTPNPTTGDYKDTGPSINIDKAVANAAEIEFFEQAFEWENLTYILFPYFWTDRKRWSSLASIQGIDASFTAFLRAGAARVVVPARPQFESQVNFYVQYGIIWGGGPVPGPNDPDYLSVAAEIKELETGATDGTVVETWQVTVPTPLIILQSNISDLPAPNVPPVSTSLT